MDRGGYSPQGHNELDTTEHTRARTHTHTHTHKHARALPLRSLHSSGRKKAIKKKSTSVSDKGYANR